MGGNCDGDCNDCSPEKFCESYRDLEIQRNELELKVEELELDLKVEKNVFKRIMDHLVGY